MKYKSDDSSESFSIGADLKESLRASAESKLISALAFTPRLRELFKNPLAVIVALSSERKPKPLLPNLIPELGMGIGAAVGTGANTPKGYRKAVITELSKISKLSLKPQKDMQYALQSKFPVANASSALKNFAIELGKVSNDVRLMASGPIAGLAELGIPAVHAGSSIMPGKVNPSLAECMNMICFSVIGNDTTVSFAAQAGQFELNVMLPGMLKAVLDSTDMLTNFLPIFAANLIDGLTANESKLRENIENSPVIVTLLTPKIGYLKSADLFKESLKTGKTIRELVVSKKLMTNKEVSSLLS